MFSNKIFKYYLYALFSGLLIGYGLIPSFLLGILFLILLAKFLILFFQKKELEAILFLPFIVFLEIAIRDKVRFLPYLSVQYTMMIAFGSSLIKRRNFRFHFNGILVLALYFLLELVNGFFTFNARITSAIKLHTFTLLITAIWASLYIFDAKFINKLFDNIKIAAFVLLGIVVVAHLQGKINYGNASNSEASGGLAPVQLSGYLGPAAFLMMISLMNSFDKRSKIIQLLFFVFTIIFMVLTFSRGGVYFVGIATAIYLFYNRTNLGNYFKFLLLVPIGMIVVNFVIDQTGGAVVDRYKAKGASNREELVAIGFQIFFEHPFIGIGTGNYNTYIKQHHLFPMESGAHNEYVRAAAEHGIIGITLYWGFFIWLLVSIIVAKPPGKQFATYFWVLFFLVTIHNGLKISMQPLLLLICIAVMHSSEIRKINASALSS